MNLTLLDYYFPFVVFFYGFIVLLALEGPFLGRLAQEHQSNLFILQLKAHAPLAWICFFAGGLWSVQNLLIS
ncbi:MAG: hypothetical protein JNM24_06870 [Bdellovibrionaceae bacterium]|nr:hypothetical protein [Pseudobdellovibrionaceae bacterium]